MTLSLRSFGSTVATAVATAQSSCAQLLDMGVGTPGRALMESVAGVGLWLQFLGLQILCRTRLATCGGVDCDSFVNDFGMTRLAGTSSTGMVTLTSFSPLHQSAVIRPGVTVRTVSAVTFRVMEDRSHPAWSDRATGYVRAAGVASVNVPVQAIVAGVSGNVAMGAISLMGTSVSGIDTVTNASAFGNGSDAETDAELKARFPVWLAAKAAGCRAAIAGSVAGLQTNLTYALMDGETPDGVSRDGFFTAVIDDGSGASSDDLLSRVYSAIDEQRALGVGFAVQRPSVLLVSATMTVTVPENVDLDTARAALIEALRNDIAAGGVGTGYAYSRLAYVAYVAYVVAGVSVLSVTDILLNGAQNDIPANTKQILLPGVISVQIIRGA
ncbi:baseplate J/gp47 family protein [Kozakia baliensis]|uniref:Baseplate protein J-like barrel domain-containing protein n=1 Tax=Kozakia baliensis TaxID=153496 RepID=A0A1D8UXD2_9PROT|nr:baseplate J/gp47 family protein [Kozakia baliensis]AOX18313.1 hypothetical protein A0U89_11790 [Kozakia baliensis]GEL62777.1 hypothetical protein KBA01_00630 [Kozakia baliensis]